MATRKTTEAIEPNEAQETKAPTRKRRKISEIMEEVRNKHIKEVQALEEQGVELSLPDVENNLESAREAHRKETAAKRSKAKEEKEKKPRKKKQEKINALEMSPADRVKAAADQIKKIKDEEDRVNYAKDAIMNNKNRRYLMLSKTQAGDKLTEKEARFIVAYVETGDLLASYIAAGHPRGKKSDNQLCNEARALLDRPDIVAEIDYMLAQFEESKIASAEEILQYFTKVMRGEIEDQFGIEASLSERTKAAQELAKRKIDAAKKTADNSITLSFVWEDLPDAVNDDVLNISDRYEQEAEGQITAGGEDK